MKYRPIFLYLAMITGIGLWTLIGLGLMNHSENYISDSGEIRIGNDVGVFSQPNARTEDSQLIELRQVDEPWNDPESIVRAFARAYPQRVDEVAYRNGDWALRIDSTWFNYAGGKMLPDAILDESDNYSRYSFYPYGPDLPDIPQYSDEEIAELEARVEQRASSGIGRYMGLMDALWGVDSFVSSDQAVKTMFLFRRQVNVHRELLEDLAGIESELFILAETDSELRTYLASIGSIAGHSWRQILGTSSRSLHSYGIAVDILPERYSNSQVYWRWARQIGLPWHSLPYEQRMMPPDSFIRAFEQAGFVWGGKWRHFDTIHFEFRPEILELNRSLWE